MKAGRLPTESAQIRDEVEGVLFTLGTQLAHINELKLRNRQAIDRTNLVAPVLTPAIERLDQMEHDLRRIQAHMADLWEYGQAARWPEKFSSG